uniref:Putative cuticle protein cph36 n=1 Tax=Corethrella appendiculata TaxID=1370023 RepID=U5EPV2_9DIPT
MAFLKPFIVFMALVVVLASAAPSPIFFHKNHHKHVIVHVPYKVHTIHHHHVEKVPVIKHVPIVKHVPVYKEVHVPVIKEVPVHYHHDHHDHHDFHHDHHEFKGWSSAGWW